MFPTVTQYTHAIDQLASGKTAEERKKLIENLVGYLGQRGEKEKLSDIVESLEELADERESVVRVTVVTAREADKASRQALKQKAESLFPRKTVVMMFEVDASVIGGACFQTKEIRFDATMAASLKQLKEEISK